MAWSFSIHENTFMIFISQHTYTQKDTIKWEYPALRASDSSVKLECASLRSFKSTGCFNSVYTYSTAL